MTFTIDFYIKKKFKGKVFDFRIQTQGIEDFKSSEELFEKLRNFFTSQSETHYINALESLSMLSGEYITHLDHRLNVLVHKVHGMSAGYE